MNPEAENPLQSKLKAELDNSEWLQKFKQLGDTLRYVKAEIPLTQLCNLKWNTKDESLIVNCPNEEVWQELSQQSEKIAKVNQKVKRLILKYGNYPELVFDQKN
ncbi:MAG: hypothetical protein QNJ60_00475 [Xenococcaceae cyanobacterium MO_188.B19]|nr:hypothetical protein [Xenococcaceae cyanobacterium MO_188.B19]